MGSPWDILATAGKIGVAAAVPPLALIPGFFDTPHPATHPVHAAVAKRLALPIDHPQVHAAATHPEVQKQFKMQFPAGMVHNAQTPATIAKLAARTDDNSAIVALAKALGDEKDTSAVSVGNSGNLAGELQKYGEDVLIRGTFTAVANEWGTDIPVGATAKILQPGICLLWDFSADDGDEGAAWVDRVTYNTAPWSIPVGSKQVLGRFNWQALSQYVPKPCLVMPGNNLEIHGTAKLAAGTYTWEGIGIPLKDISGIDAALERYLSRHRVDVAALRSGIMSG